MSSPPRACHKFERRGSSSSSIRSRLHSMACHADCAVRRPNTDMQRRRPTQSLSHDQPGLLTSLSLVFAMSLFVVSSTWAAVVILRCFADLRFHQQSSHFMVYAVYGKSWKFRSLGQEEQGHLRQDRGSQDQQVVGKLVSCCGLRRVVNGRNPVDWAWQADGAAWMVGLHGRVPVLADQICDKVGDNGHIYSVLGQSVTDSKLIARDPDADCRTRAPKGSAKMPRHRNIAGQLSAAPCARAGA